MKTAPQPNRKRTVKYIVRAAIIAALYALLTLALAPIAYGPLQFRAAESMTLLPLLFAEAVPGLALGCLIANIFSAYGWYDMVFGTAATLLSAVLTRLIGAAKRTRRTELMPIAACLPPIFINAAVLPLIWLLFMGDKGYLINMWTILATQSAVIFILGLPLYYALKRTGIHLK